MKKFFKALLAFSALAAIIFSTTAYAEKIIYKAGILNDYYYSGNNISLYAQTSVKNAFSYADNTALEFTEYSLNSCIDAVNTDTVDFAAMVPENDTLKICFDYTNEPIATGFLALFTARDSQMYFDDFRKFNGMKIGMLNDCYFENILSEYSKKNDFTYTPIYFNTIDELCGAARSGMVDAMLSPATTAPDGMRLIAKCGGFDYYCVVRKGNTRMLDTLNEIISELKEDSPFYLSSEYQNSFKIPYYNMAALTENDFTALKNQQKLRVLVPDDNYPMSYYDVQKGEYAGVYIDILKKITDNAGIELEYVPDDQKDMTMTSIMQGKADAILTVSASQQGLIEATEPYTSISYLPVGKEDINVFEDNSLHVGILEDDAWIKDYLSETHPSWFVDEFSSINSLFSAAEDEDIDIALLSSPDMQTKTSLIAHPSLSIIRDFQLSIPVRLGVSRITCPQYVPILLNKVIHGISVSESEFESKVYTLSHIYVPNFRDMLYANKFWTIIILLLFIALIVIIKLREHYFKNLAQTDSLTKIHNMRYFEKESKKICAKNPSQPYLLALVDAKNFKLVNNRFGTIIGDQTIIDIANKIKEIFDGKGLYARLKADSFAVLISDTEENRALIAKLEDIDIHIHDSSRYYVPIKIGVCPIPELNSEIPLSTYIDKAKIATAAAQNSTSNYLCYFTAEMESQLNMRNDIEVEMEQALNRGDFVIYYQPKYDLSNDSIIGAEALVRWEHKEKGLISPGLFVPLFEKNGFIVKVDFHVYDTVLRMIKERIERNEPVVPISMNVSRCHLVDKNFVEKLEALVKKYNVPKKYIEMEITESVFSREDVNAISLIFELKEHDFAISMDDFGSGYSSLNLLRKMPIDTLKIDKAFIDDAENSAKSQVIIQEVISMAKKINVKTICEGVETKGQRDFIKAAGCDMVQGYFYSKPLPQKDFEALLNLSN